MKNLLMIFVLALSTGVFACGSTDKAADSDTTTTTEETKTEEASV